LRFEFYLSMLEKKGRSDTLGCKKFMT